MNNLNISKRATPIEMNSDEFRKAGYKMVDEIATFLDGLPDRPVTTGEQPQQIRKHLPEDTIPAEGTVAIQLLTETSKLLFDHSLFNGHPRFWGYITASAAPIGALADMLAATVNPNIGGYNLSPMATEIERQVLRWIADFVGYNINCGGIFVSGGNMANFVCFLAARRAKLNESIREQGLPKYLKYLIYCPEGTHTWIQKAMDLFGFGTENIRWIKLNEHGQMKLDLLAEQIKEDIKKGYKPFMVIANAGSVGTGAVDRLDEISEICTENDLWFHIDGAYGAPAAALEENKSMFKGIEKADSIAMDPHKWFYSPLEAGCALVKDPAYMTDAFSYRPNYYNFSGDGEEEPVNFYEYGFQNSRGFRALKVWLMLRQAGRNGYIKMIRDDIKLAEYLYQKSSQHPELEAISQNLSITTFRYKPAENIDEEKLNNLNEMLLNKLQSGGEVFLSNAIINGKYCLRACIVNFRTDYEDIDALVEIVVREGRKIKDYLKSIY